MPVFNPDTGSATYVLDAAPDIGCAVRGDLGSRPAVLIYVLFSFAALMVYCVVLPAALLRRLVAASMKGKIASRKFAISHVSSHGLLPIGSKVICLTQCGLRSQAWVLLKYKPARFWFEVPFLTYKCIVIVAAETLDSGSAEDTALLIGILAWTVTVMLVVIAVAKPFRGADDDFGLTSADKSEIVALLSMLLNVAIGWWCWTIKEERGYMTALEELLVTILGLFCACAPLAFMAYQASVLKMQQKRKAKRSNTQSELEHDGDDEQGSGMFESDTSDTPDTNEQKADSLPPLLLKILRLDTVDKDSEEQKRKQKQKQKQADGSAEPSGAGGKAGKSKSDSKQEKNGGKAKQKQADGSAEPSGAGGKAGKSKSDHNKDTFVPFENPALDD